MSKRSTPFLVEDIIEAAEKIREYTRGLSFENFVEDQKTVDAVIRNFEIIGEAASRVSEVYRESNQVISWRQLSDFRNRLIHEYFGVDLEILWDIIQLEMDELIQELKRIKPNSIN